VCFLGINSHKTRIMHKRRVWCPTGLCNCFDILLSSLLVDLEQDDFISLKSLLIILLSLKILEKRFVFVAAGHNFLVLTTLVEFQWVAVS